jgi:hypothetical protein
MIYSLEVPCRGFFLKLCPLHISLVSTYLVNLMTTIQLVLKIKMKLGKASFLPQTILAQANKTEDHRQINNLV